MTKRILTQAEADALLALPKRPASDEVYEFPAAGAKLSVPLVSHDGREEFALDVRNLSSRMRRSSLVFSEQPPLHRFLSRAC